VGVSKEDTTVVEETSDALAASGTSPEGMDALAKEEAAKAPAEGTEAPAADRGGAAEGPADTGVRRAEFQVLSSRPGARAGDTMQLLMDVTVPVAVRLGGTQMALRDVLALGAGSVVRLDQPLGEPVDILVNGERVGRGEIVVVGDQFGVRVSELLDPAARKKA
jgi:flagellar motor switch protein FliN/FliY